MLRPCAKFGIFISSRICISSGSSINPGMINLPGKVGGKRAGGKHETKEATEEAMRSV